MSRSKSLPPPLDDLQERTGRDVPLHVDAASGGMVAPFLQPDLEWGLQADTGAFHQHFRPQIRAGTPDFWVVYASAEYLPEDLIFHVSYLGGDMPTLALNFSRPGAQVLLQYYLFVRLGMDGYRTVHQMSQNIALMLSSEIGAMEPFELVTKGDDIPVFAWRMKDGYTTRVGSAGPFRPASVPAGKAYPMPDSIADIWVMDCGSFWNVSWYGRSYFSKTSKRR